MVKRATGAVVHVTYLHSEVISMPIRHLEGFQSSDTLGIIGDIEAVKKLVSHFDKSCSFLGFFTEIESKSLGYTLTQNLHT